MESRIAPAYVAALAGAAATLTGDAASDTLVISAVDGLLHHNRFAAGDPGFASDSDFDSTTPGVQTLAADAASSVAIALGTGNDTVLLGGNQRAALLKASFTVTNTGADGDTLEVNDAAGTDAANLAIGTTIAGSSFNITRAGDVFGTLTLRTGAGADSLALSGALATLTVIETGAGNDTVTSSATTALQIDGGNGRDTLNGGNQGDVIHGGAGNDTLIGRQGNDVLFGDDGLDTFVWNPGDGSDTIDGGTGTDLLTFNGANIAEAFALSANGNHVRFTRNIANIVMDTAGVEQMELNMLGGADVLTVSDLSTTSLRTIRLNLALAGVPDGSFDAITLNGSDLDDDLRVTATTDGVRATGLGASIDVTGFEATDQLNLIGGLGLDNAFATSAAMAKLAITLSGETASNAPDPLHFSTPASYDAGKTPASLAVGNLFGTGAVISNDLVVADTKSNAVLILPNAGNGTFLPAVRLGTSGKAPRAVALEDFNGDGERDIAVTNSGSGNVAILLNNGDGTFAAPTLFAAGKTPSVLRVGDVTGDGELDLVMITAGNTVTRLAGNGDGTFGAPLKLPTGGLAPSDLALADFSADGRLDIAVANAGSANITLLRANPDFTFAAPVKTRVGIKPTALATGDFDGDGHADLVVTHGVSRFVSVLLNASPTTIAFSSQIKLSHPGRNTPVTVAVGDVDGDGRADLVVGNTGAGSVSVFVNAGGAIFRPSLTFDLDNTPPRKSSSLALADLDNDGRLDFAIANGGTGDVSIISRLPV